MKRSSKSKKSNKERRQSNRMIEVQLHENDEVALQRIGIEQGNTRIEALGIHKVHTTKAKSPKWGISPHITVERVHKYQADTSSLAWQRYIKKEITFAEFKASGRML
jgi:hypothetical protein